MGGVVCYDGADTAMSDYPPLKRREARRVRKFLDTSIRMTATDHPPDQHSWSTFEQVTADGRRIPDFRVCSCGEIRRLR